jgi:hypothetical protein
MTGGTLPTKYRGSLGGLTLFALIAISLGSPLWATAQQTDAVVAIEPPEWTVNLQSEFTVAVSIEDVSELYSYEFAVVFDPTVVEVLEAMQGPFLESTGQSSVSLGPSIDDQAGTVTFAAFGAPGQSGPWPSGAGELATIRLRAVGDGFTALDLQDVDLFDGSDDRIAVVAEDGQVQVGGGEVPTSTPTEEAVTSDTPAPTSAATATETATPPPEATATKTPTGGATTAPEATATENPEASATEAPTGGATSSPQATPPPAATPTGWPTEGGAPAAAAGATSTTQPGRTPVEEGSPSATAEPAEAQGETAEPAVTSMDEPLGGETPSGVSPWWLVAATVLALGGVALIGVGVFAFGLRRWPGEGPMEDARG